MEKPSEIEFHDHHPEVQDFQQEILEGLTQSQKRISPKYFYDKRGSELFDRICQLDEYYPTRTEISILKRNASEIASLLGKQCLLIEYGSGASQKVRILIEALERRLSYVAVDISKQHLIEATLRLARSFPELEVTAVCADYTKPFPVPQSKRYPASHRAVFFSGSTIGNLNPAEARALLRTTATVAGKGGSLLIGVDLKKDKEILHAAYNDSSEVTAAFNLNLLTRINRDLQTDFDLSQFRHRAFYNSDQGRVEMHLESLAPQTVKLNGARIRFEAGETIHTENSYKFTVREFQELAKTAGYAPKRAWTDPRQLFSLHYLTAEKLPATL